MAPGDLSKHQTNVAMPDNEGASKARRRASVACTACRERRTRCVKRTGEASCAQCLDNGLDCIFRNDDQRRKPVSKAYVNLLQDKINQLEEALREKEEEPHSGRQKANNDDANSIASQGKNTQHAQPVSAGFPLPTVFGHEPTFPNWSPPAADPDGLTLSASSPSSSGGRTPPTVSKLLSTNGHASLDQIAGRLRCFDFTENCDIYSNSATESEHIRRQAKEQMQRTRRVLSALSPATHDYLMDLFWQLYNSVIHVIHRQAFEEGRDTDGGLFYSGFLHLCILAIGYRFADKQRPDILGIALPGGESTLHREAKYMLDYEMERPGGIPSIAALLLLGDLEVGCGRYNVGWLYSGMANRLCFDVGLHLDLPDSELSRKDIEIGRMALWACVVYDRYWALFLDRPMAFQLDGLEVYKPPHRFVQLDTDQTTDSGKSLDREIYQALFEVMELSGKITSLVHSMSTQSSNLDRHVYLRMAAVDRDLERWYARLPPALRYTAENVKTAPFSFFMLHQQYYATMILLHRQFAHYNIIVDDGGKSRVKNNVSTTTARHLSTFSHDTCTTCAGKIAQIFWQHRQRFDTRTIFSSGLQHAGTAATALVGAIASSTDRGYNHKNMMYLECLAGALKDMRETYYIAERMASMLDAVLAELKDLRLDRGLPFSAPARRGSSENDEHETDLPPKKRLTSKAGLKTPPAISVPCPSDTFRRPPENILPSPAPTSAVHQDKPSWSGTANGDVAVIDADMSNMDGPWPAFDGLDPAVMDNDMAPFASIWPGSEDHLPLATPHTSFLSPGITDKGFMALLEDCDRAAQDTTFSSIDNRVPLSKHDANTGTPNSALLLQGPTQSDELGMSFSNQKIQGRQPPKSPEVRHREALAQPDNIWTEMIS